MDLPATATTTEVPELPASQAANTSKENPVELLLSSPVATPSAAMAISLPDPQPGPSDCHSSSLSSSSSPPSPSPSGEPHDIHRASVPGSSSSTTLQQSNTTATVASEGSEGDPDSSPDYSPTDAAAAREVALAVPLATAHLLRMPGPGLSKGHHQLQQPISPPAARKNGVPMVAAPAVSGEVAAVTGATRVLRAPRREAVEKGDTARTRIIAAVQGIASIDTRTAPGAIAAGRAGQVAAIAVITTTGANILGVGQKNEPCELCHGERERGGGGGGKNSNAHR